ncbi:glycosyltransferase family 39 protein [Pendulispora albinea]|uniref:Glycosyltransferase family 39 protein n=1 Tax=Pendulispora albinea TaxID=2741071 RepID=A0ABZ2M3Y3_9BACT
MGHALRRWLLDVRFVRLLRLSSVVFLVPLVVYLAVYLWAGEAFQPSPDGYYSWLFARSLVFDGDFDFTNDYALCGDEFDIGIVHATGRPDNPFYVGPAVFWTPWLLVLRAGWTVFLGAQAAERASCGGWMTVLGLLTGPLAGALVVWLSYATARMVVSKRAAAACALLFAFTSPLFGYSTTIAQYSHVYLTLCVAVLVYVSFRAVSSQPWARGGRAWGLVAATLAVAVLHRLPAVLYAAIPAAAVVILLWRRARSRGWAAGSVVLGTASGIGLTFGLYVYLYGSMFVTPQGSYYVHLSQPNPFLLLFGVQGGFFFWMPAAWLAVAGAVLALVGKRPRAVDPQPGAPAAEAPPAAEVPPVLGAPELRIVALGCLAAAAAEVYVSSSVLDWSGRFSLGARRLLPLTPIVVLFAALVVERLVRSIPRRAFDGGAAIGIGLTLINNVPATTRIPYRYQDLTQEQLYGACSPFRPLWAWADRHIGDVALLPAQLYFRYRYGLPPAGYRAAIVRRYQKELRNLQDQTAEFRFGNAWMRETSTGFVYAEDGARMTGDEARVVFAAEWPSATHVAVLAKTNEPVELRIERGPAGAHPPFFTATLAPTREPVWIELPVSGAALRSGLNEWIFRKQGTADLVLVAIKPDDHALPKPAGNASTQPRRN